MVYKTENLTASTIGYALDVASLRQQAIASNIANINTEGYVPQQVSFARQMEQMRAIAESGTSPTASMFSHLKIEVEPMLDANGGPAKIELDTEVAAMSQNSVYYQALVKGLSRHYAILASAMSDGKK